MQKSFKVSSGLKDLIGRDLITNEFVAIFELVKNSFDAHATKVKIIFEEDRIVITDNGKGMSRDDILDKWLFVAYSAKKEGTEDRDYRGKISQRKRPYAGAKGVGRFSCDRLGKRLLLSSRADKDGSVQTVDIDWTLYEKDAKLEFGRVNVEIGESPDFIDCPIEFGRRTGTVVDIRNLRSHWDRDHLQELKRSLSKLINPFAYGPSSFDIGIVAEAERAEDEGKDRAEQVNGRVENNILEIIERRTTSIHIKLVENGEFIETRLDDRGENVYHIRELNEYAGLKRTNLDARIYFLNRSAKMVFARRMGLASVQFGSIFLFRNNFRVFPIGEERDDFFGLTRRKQQGVRRYLGSRDLIGRVEIDSADGFEESTSRDKGLILNPRVDNLIKCIHEKCVRRLERYVVDITWKDRYDTDVDNMSRMRLDENSWRISQLVSRLADTGSIQILDYNPDLVRIIDEKSESFEKSLSALEILADKTGDAALLDRVADAKNRIVALQAAEAEAREAERRAESRAAVAERATETATLKYDQERDRNRFLMAASSLDHDTILNLHHQIIMYASDVHHGVKRMMGKLRHGQPIHKRDWIDFLDRMAYRNSQILTASRFATKGGYKQKATKMKTDLAVYIRDYVATVSSLWAPRGLAVDVDGDGGEFIREFRPIDIGIVIDNLVSNAAKARASNIQFFLRVSGGSSCEFDLTVADNGSGWPPDLTPLMRAFEKGVTTTDGSGLGLYHVKQIVEGMGGIVEAYEKPRSDDLAGAHLRLRLSI